MIRAQAFLVFLFPAAASAASFSAKVTGVTSCDSITVQHEIKTLRVRLHGIICPDRGPLVEKARLLASKAVLGKVVRVVVKESHRGYVMARVFFVDKDRDQLRGWSRPTCLNDLLVRSNLARVDPDAEQQASGDEAKAAQPPEQRAENARGGRADIERRREIAKRRQPDIERRRRIAQRRADAAERREIARRKRAKRRREIARRKRAKLREEARLRGEVQDTETAPESQPSPRVCQTDSDCVLDYSVRRTNPKDPCSCLRCGRVMPRPINRAAARLLARKERPQRCPQQRCPKCWIAPIPHNLKASCHEGQCVLGKPAAK